MPELDTWEGEGEMDQSATQIHGNLCTVLATPTNSTVLEANILWGLTLFVKEERGHSSGLHFS